MEARIDDISRKEHLLAEKAQDILDHQQQLKSLQLQKEELQQEKPTTDKEQLSYEESLELGKRVKKYEERLQGLEIQIQKLIRELCGLKKQAKKLLPVSNVKVKVSTYSDDAMSDQTYCVKHIKNKEKNQSKEHFDIERLQ